MRKTQCNRAVRQKMLTRLGLTDADNAPAAPSTGQTAGLPRGEQIRRELLKQCERKPLRDVLQLDAFITREPVAGVNHGSCGTTDADVRGVKP